MCVCVCVCVFVCVCVCVCGCVGLYMRVKSETGKSEREGTRTKMDMPNKTTEGKEGRKEKSFRKREE